MSANTAATARTVGNSHQQVVLEGLSNSATPMSALELARICNLEKAVVNACLYNLLQRGKACIEETHGKRPLWSTTVASIEERYQEEEQNLKSVLEENGAIGASTFSIALKLSKQVKVVNQMLYALQEAGEVERVHISPPAWRLKIADRNSRSDVASPRELQDTVETNSSRKRQRSILEMSNQAHSSDSSSDSSSPEADGDTPAKKPCLQEEATVPRPKLSVEGALSKFHTDPRQDQVDKSWANKCAKTVWEQYNNLNKETRENDIVAGFLLKEASSNKPRLVAIGSGTAIAGGQNYSMQGLVVHDSHAEIVARRSLLRWLYHQLEMVESDDANSSSVFVAVKSDTDHGQDRHYQIVAPFELWLYISLAPCGDGGVYSRTDLMLANKNQNLSASGRGQFRMKTEAGQGTKSCSTRAGEICHEITMDGLPRGDRALCHSCSDKIAKWNVLGVQGALLSRLISPLYLTGVVIGDAFHHGNLARALCCRSEAALGNASLVPPFALAHPRIRQALKSSPRHQQIKKHNGKSINWMEGEAKAEVVDSRSGLVADQKRPSQICKSSLFSQFSKLVPGATKLTYLENKILAGDYHTAKKTWRDAMEHRHHGRWMQKPKEVDIFKI